MILSCIGANSAVGHSFAAGDLAGVETGWHGAWVEDERDARMSLAAQTRVT